MRLSVMCLRTHTIVAQRISLPTMPPLPSSISGPRLRAPDQPLPAKGLLQTCLQASALGLGGVLLCLGGCASGPDYVPPKVPAAAQGTSFKEGQDWRPASPGQAASDQAWWTWFADSQLDSLVQQATAANASLAQMAAQYRQAQARVPAAQAAGRPTVGLSAGVGNEQSTNNGLYIGGVHNWSLQATWEPDLWGHVDRSVEAAKSAAQASAADLAAARLLLQAALVSDYLQLRVADAQLDLYAHTVQAYEKAWELTKSQLRAGVATQSDVSLAEATLQSARAQATDIDIGRRQTEHAIAVLVGKMPSEFSIARYDATLPPQVPEIPAILPSQLLERRPDIAAAERRMAQANANIGVAQTALYPNLGLSASGGSSGPSLGNWFATPYWVWAVGAQVAAVLYDGGLNAAQQSQALAAFDAAAASYRQTVLSGFQEVEDNLAALHDLTRERAQLEAGLAAARRAEQVLLSQYRAGTAPYLALLNAQATTLSSGRAVLQVQGRQLAASVALIMATGGGWTTIHN